MASAAVKNKTGVREPRPAETVEGGRAVHQPGVDSDAWAEPEGIWPLGADQLGRWLALEEPNAPANTIGIRKIMFAVDDIADSLARLRTHGAELVGEVAQYEDSYLLCYLRGPGGIIVALAEQLNA